MLALLIALSTALLVYISFFQRNFISKRYIVFTFLIFVVVFFGAAALNRLFIVRFRRRSRRSECHLCLWSSLVLALLLFVNFEPIPFYLLEKKQAIIIQSEVEQSAESGLVEVVSVRNSLGYIPLEQLCSTAECNYHAGNLVIQDGASLHWHGYFNEYLEISFEPMYEARIVHIDVNGVGYDLNLQEKIGGEDIVFRQENKPSIISLLPFIFSFIMLAIYLLAVLLNLPYIYPIKLKNVETDKNNFWYGLPLLISSVFVLLVFWPGMMSNDSLGQWGQAINMDISDWHPIFHTYLTSQLIEIWYSPALIAILQILALCMVFAWGMNVLHKYRVPPAVLWAVAILFAIFPSNLLLPITLWKDIGYSISLLALFIVVLQIALSSGEWLSGKRSWLILGVTGFCVAIFRQNGFIVAALTLALLAIPYGKYKNVIFFGLLITMMGWLGVRGLLNWKFNSSNNHESQTNLVLLPHIAAHVAAETPLNGAEETYLNSLMPLPDWDYDCCYIGNISYNTDFDRQTFLQNFPKNLGITIDLFRKDPLVDFKHQACASEIIWRFNNNRCSFKSLHAFNDTQSGRESWILPNDFALKEHSLIPVVIPLFMKYFQAFDLFNDYPILLVKPAFYLLLSLIVIAAVALQRRNLFLLLIPMLTQVTTLAAIIFAPSFRYQYGMCLIGLFSLALYFLPSKEESEK